jgi:hypothetical protein
MVVEDDGKKGIRLCKENSICDLKRQLDCYEFRCQDTNSEV